MAIQQDLTWKMYIETAKSGLVSPERSFQSILFRSIFETSTLGNPTLLISNPVLVLEYIRSMSSRASSRESSQHSSERHREQSRRRESRAPSRSDSGDSEKDYRISVNLWGRGDAARDDPPAHWGTMIYKHGAERGDLHHVRKQDEFYYERTVDRYVDSETCSGRSEVAHISRRRSERAAALLDEYGQDPEHIPTGSRNCQDWTVGAIGVLERNRIASSGSEDYWKGQIGRPSASVGANLVEDGRSWIPTQTVPTRRSGPADATMGVREQQRRPGRLNMAQFEHLSASRRS